MSKPKRVVALIALSAAVFMVMLDTTVVTVALPTIVRELRASGTAASWLLNAYMIPFGGFLLPGGRLADVYGQRRVFLVGVLVFTGASISCALAASQGFIIGSRAIQGLGGAMVVATSMPLTLSLFPDPVERAYATSVNSFICAAGTGLGEIIGGVLTGSLNWHWIFLANIPIGISAFACGLIFIPRVSVSRAPQLNLGRFALLTSALTMAVYLVVRFNDLGGTSPQVLGLLLVFALQIALILRMEQRAAEPIVPRGLLRSNDFWCVNILLALLGAVVAAWAVIMALYLQNVLGYDAVQVGFAFVPADAIIAAVSVGAFAKIVNRFGTRGPSTVGFLLITMGLGLFARLRSDTIYTFDVLPGMLLVGVGTGVACGALLLGALTDAGDGESGVTAGLLNTTFIFGGAIGLALLVALADARTQTLRRMGLLPVEALEGGYRIAFLVGAVTAAGALAIASSTLLRRPISRLLPKC